MVVFFFLRREKDGWPGGGAGWLKCLFKMSNEKVRSESFFLCLPNNSKLFLGIVYPPSVKTFLRGSPPSYTLYILLRRWSKWALRSTKLRIRILLSVTIDLGNEINFHCSQIREIRRVKPNFKKKITFLLSLHWLLGFKSKFILKSFRKSNIDVCQPGIIMLVKINKVIN